jgi:hypothetical protein
MMGVDNIMAFRQLHSYPKVFNEQGKLKAFPFRRPIRVHFWNAFLVSTAFYFLFDAYREWTFTKYAHSEFFSRDVPLRPPRKLSSFCENDPSTASSSATRSSPPQTRSAREASSDRDPNRDLW